MPTAFLLGTLTLMAFLWIRSRRLALSRHDLAQAMRAFAAVFGSFATTGLAIGGRWGLAAVAFIATLAFLRSLLSAWRSSRDFGGSGNETTTETSFLKMRLDHDSGEMDGVVLKGKFKDVVLSLLELSQLFELRQEIEFADFQSVSLIDAYLDTRFADWRGAAGESETSPIGQPMTEEYALKILGLDPGAGLDEIKHAHRKLMSKVHPDRGGSDHLAAQVNAAKELLLQLRG